MYQVQWVWVGLWVHVLANIMLWVCLGKLWVTIKKGKSSDETHRLVKWTVQIIFSPSIFASLSVCDLLTVCLTLCPSVIEGGFMCLADVIGVDWAQGEQTVLMCWFPRALTVILWHDPLWLGPQTQCDWTMHTSILYVVEMILNECIFVSILCHGSMYFASDLWTLLGSMQSYKTYMQHSDLLYHGFYYKLVNLLYSLM